MLNDRPIRGLVEYQNLPRSIGAAVSSNLATLHELQTVYSLRDLYDLLEVASIDAANARAREKQAQDS